MTALPRTKPPRSAPWALSVSLESALVEPLQPDYDNVVNRARARLTDDTAVP